MARARRTIRAEILQVIPRGAKLLVAVSGGVDSVALLHVLQEVRKLCKLHLEVAHVDHAARSASQSDAEFVAELASKSGAPFHLHRCGPRKRGANFEAWGREVRYRFFREVRENQGLDYILTAHTANDLAETLLMRLLSNRDPRTIERFDESRALIRPLLRIQRSQIEQYIEKYRLTYREDSTNSDTRFLRNRVRHKLIPILEREFDPRIVEVLAERADSLDGDFHALGVLTSGVVVESSKHEFGSRAWLRAVRRELKTQPEPLQWRSAEEILKDKLGFRVGRAKATVFVQVMLGTTAAVELPRGVTIRRNRGELVISGV